MTEPSTQSESVDSHLRGSSLLVFGRVFAMAVNLCVQVLTIRYLTRADYGAFAYALVMVELFSLFSLLGLDKSVARYSAIFHERSDYPRILGSMALGIGVVIVISLAVIAFVMTFRNSLSGWLRTEPESIELLVLLLVLGPSNAIDSILTALYSVFSSPMAILVRRHILGPGLKLVSILVTMALGGSVVMLAGAFVISSLIGLFIYMLLMVKLLRSDEHRGQWSAKSVRVPVRTLFAFALPMFGSDLVFMLYNSAVVFFLEFYHTAEELAAFQAVRPFARLNGVVIGTFSLLFFPILARFFERGDRQGMCDVHQRTGVWVMLLSFPIFAVTFGFADTIALHVLGKDYADVGILLALLTLGYFVHAILGIAPRTLKVMGELRSVVVIDLSSLVLALVACVTLIPRWGALGVVITIDAVLVTNALLCAIAVRRRFGLMPFGRRQMPAVIVVLLCVSALVADRLLLPSDWRIDAILVGLSLVATALVGRRIVEVGDVFPELSRVPLLGRFLAGPSR